MLVNQTKWLVLRGLFRGRRLRRYDQGFWTREVALQVMCVINYAHREILKPQGWVARFHTFIKLASNDLKVKVSYLFCNTVLQESQLNGGSILVVLKGMFHTHDPFCSSVSPLSNPQKFATLLINSDRACLAIREASLSGKSESLSSSIRDSEGTSSPPGLAA